jgi:anti-sigma factor RsiW
MQQHSDEALVAYLDGELDAAEQGHVEAWLAADPTARDRLAALAQSATLVRSAFADIVNEPVPEYLIAAARGETLRDGTDAVPDQPHEAEHGAEIVTFQPKAARVAAGPVRRWYIGMAAAAGLFGVMFGGAGTYFGLGILSANSGGDQKIASAVANNIWLDNAAGFYKLLVNAGDSMPLDVPANSDSQGVLQKISKNLSQQQTRLPDLNPWGLNFRGARLIVVDGRPAAQLIYATDNKAIGPLSLIIGASKEGDINPTFGRRQDVNMLYWRHSGRAYTLVGQTDIGYLWGIANDVAWQLDAI